MFRRSLPLVLVFGLAGSPALSAASTPWSVILELLRWEAPGVSTKAGCSISPDGQPMCPKRERREPRPGSLKHGCSISPDGHTVCEP